MNKKIKIVLWTALVVVILNVILNASLYKNLLPYYWGSLDIVCKREYLIKNKGKYNTVFIGSSKTHNQVVPELFDRRACENKLDIRSYNFGVSGLLPLESLHIYRNLLEKDNLSFKYVFLELDWIETINYENLNQVRSSYWLTPDNYSKSVHSIVTSSVPLKRSLWGYFHYSVDFIENTLNIGKVQEFIKLRSDSSAQMWVASDSNRVFKGYTPLMNTMNKTEFGQFDEVISSANETVKNEGTLKNNKPSAGYLKALQDIITLSNSKGIHLYFVVPLQWKYFQYQEVLPIINNIRGAGIICLFDAEKYKSVYQPENFADPNHLNYKGAPLYTEELFKLFKSQAIK